jgi:hypothetical protein
MQLPDDGMTVTISLTTVCVMRWEDGGLLEANRVPGWCVLTETNGKGSQMITTTTLPRWLPPIARSACQLLRVLVELSPHQIACANAALAVLIEENHDER